MRSFACALLAVVVASPVAAQVNAELHTGMQPAVIAPEQGQRRQLPGGRSMLLKVGPSTTGAAYFFLGSEILPPKAAIPRHRHEVDEELLIVQAGTLKVFLNDSAHTAVAGSVIFLPPRTWIRVVNEGTEPATLMFVFPRGAVERCFQFIGRDSTGQLPPSSTAARLEEKQACQMTYH